MQWRNFAHYSINSMWLYVRVFESTIKIDGIDFAPGKQLKGVILP